MQAIFMAIGPDFNQQIEIDSLKNVDVYHIVCKILNITANPFATAGSLDNLARIFGSRNSTISSRNNCSLSFIDTSIVLFVLFSNYFMRICMK
jgi:tRNA(Phe) wybutosine-synthesizing methylase Tyw3